MCRLHRVEWPLYSCVICAMNAMYTGGLTLNFLILDSIPGVVGCSCEKAQTYCWLQNDKKDLKWTNLKSRNILIEYARPFGANLVCLGYFSSLFKLICRANTDTENFQKVFQEIKPKPPLICWRKYFCTWSCFGPNVTIGEHFLSVILNKESIAIDGRLRYIGTLTSKYFLKFSNDLRFASR